MSIVSLSFDRKYFLFIGSVSERTDTELLSEELGYLTPFRISSTKEKIIYENMEDFSFFRKRFHLTGNVKLSKKFYGKKSFHKPLMLNYPRTKKALLDFHSVTPKRTCIILPYINPVIRGKVVALAVTYGVSLYVTTGDVQGTNTVSTSTLTTRSLLYNNVPITSIIKVPKETGEYAIIDALEKLDELKRGIETLYIACTSMDIAKVRISIRLWKKNGMIDNALRFHFICVFSK